MSRLVFLLVSGSGQHSSEYCLISIPEQAVRKGMKVRTMRISNHKDQL
jgi:hypothetical protein